MGILEVISIIALFCVVLSWTDFQPHIGYSFHISKNIGWYTFPVVWFQSFFLHKSFFKSGKSQLDLSMLSLLERGIRKYLSKEENCKYTWEERRGNYFEITPLDCRTVRFEIPNDGSTGVSINGYEKLIPPRLALQMMYIAKDMKNNHKKNEKANDKKPLYR